VHLLYQEELFPELNFSKKFSENSLMDHASGHDSSFELPIFEQSDDEEKALNNL